MTDIDLTKVLADFSFVKVLATSAPRNWNGVSATIYELSKLNNEPVLPQVFWAQTTLVLHTKGLTNKLRFYSNNRWQNAISSPGTFFFNGADQVKKIYWTEATTNTSVSISDSLITQVAAEVQEGDPSHVRIMSQGLFHDSLLAQLELGLYSLLRDADYSTKLYAESVGVMMVHHLLKFYTGKRQSISVPGKMKQHQVQAAIDYIHSHFDHDLSLEQIANVTGMSVAHFTRLFRQETGYSPYQYFIRVRVEQAALLLKQGRTTIAEVAQLVGFYDQSHLLRHFKRVYGVSPKQML